MGLAACCHGGEKGDAKGTRKSLAHVITKGSGMCRPMPELVIPTRTEDEQHEEK